ACRRAGRPPRTRRKARAGACGLLLAALLLGSCAAPADQVFRDAYQDDMTAAQIGDRLRQRLLERFPPGRADLYEAVRYLSQAGARCRAADDGAQRCTYTLLTPAGASGPLAGQEFVHFDVDLAAQGEKLRDIQVLAN
ncbi:MAG: hypothetical protein ACM3N5_03160, partial [Candidatus Eiseniibacteriota bacterium]